MVGGHCLSLALCVFFCLIVIFDVTSTDAFFGGGYEKSHQQPPSTEEDEIDYYEVLGLGDLREEATEKDVRQKYRELSRKYHPDVSKGDESREMYSRINRANEVLSDKRKRRMYDMRGEEGLRQLESLSKQDNSMNPFAQLFGGGGGGIKGQNMEGTIGVSLEDVYMGARKVFSIEKEKVCNKCKGTGSKKGSGFAACPHCRGQGAVIQRYQLGPNMYQDVQQTCPHCQGRGRVAKYACPACGGKRVVHGSSTLNLDVEQGIPEDYQVTFEMESNESPDVVPGDLIMTVRTEPHPRFTRYPNGLDLETSLTISLKDALLGFKRSVTHLDGEQVPVQSTGVTPYGTMLKVRGKGMPRHHLPSERGDLYVKVVFNLPKVLTEEQRKKIEEHF